MRVQRWRHHVVHRRRRRRVWGYRRPHGEQPHPKNVAIQFLSSHVYPVLSFTLATCPSQSHHLFRAHLKRHKAQFLADSNKLKPVIEETAETCHF